MWVRSPVTTDNFSILYFVTFLIRGTIIKFRGHRGFNTEFSSPKSPVCTTAVHCHNMNREMVVYKSVWTQRHKKDQRSEISTTGLRSRISEGPRAFAGSALSECHFLVKIWIFSVNPPPTHTHTIMDMRNNNRRNVLTHARVKFGQSETSSLLRGGD